MNSQINPVWGYNEMKQVGTDYTEVAEVEKYDERHEQFRHITQENEHILNTLDVQKHHIVMDIGCGTGNFAIQAAKRCGKVYAIDVSQPMLDFAKSKAQKSGLSNIRFCHAGFLTYPHSDDPVDFIITNAALHHLPDFWKAVALKRISSMLKEGGRLFLGDVVFCEENFEINISNWLIYMEKIGGKELAEDAAKHIREEYSTFSWIMEGLLERSGFRIDSADSHDNVFVKYLCTRISN